MTNELEFFAPHNVERCASILGRQHEPAQVFAWDWQWRTVVNLRPIGPDAVEFRLRRMPRSWLSGFTWIVQVKGTLQQMGERSTLVTANASMPVWGTAVVALIFAIMEGVGIWLLVESEEGPATGLMILAFALIGMVAYFVQVWWQKRRLFTLLKNVLGDAVTPMWG